MEDNKRAVVAMSGGVDSSVAALLLKQQGYDAVGISMQVWDYRKSGGCASKATCCSPDDFTDARSVAASLDVPYYVFDFEKYFEKEVIERFVATYQAGQTPNPCIDCNSRVKFKELRNRAQSLGYEKVATGHYAQIKEISGQYRLLRGLDRDKDQSYFLYGLKYRELSETIFPVGHLTKPQVRELAAQAGIATADKPESQDICFVSGSVQDFLVAIGSTRKVGQIIDRSGQVLGEHSGIHNFTVGQRKGLRLASASGALYVLEICPETNRIIVGPKEQLESSGFWVNELNWLDQALSVQFEKGQAFEFTALAQLRHRHNGVPVKIFVSDTGQVRVEYIEQSAVASPGQAAVFYDMENQVVLGGGRIQLNASILSRSIVPLSQTTVIPSGQ